MGLFFKKHGNSISDLFEKRRNLSEEIKDIDHKIMTSSFLGIDAKEREFKVEQLFKNSMNIVESLVKYLKSQNVSPHVYTNYSPLFENEDENDEDEDDDYFTDWESNLIEQVTAYKSNKTGIKNIEILKEYVLVCIITDYKSKRYLAVKSNMTDMFFKDDDLIFEAIDLSNINSIDLQDIDLNNYICKISITRSDIKDCSVGTHVMLVDYLETKAYRYVNKYGNTYHCEQ